MMVESSTRHRRVLLQIDAATHCEETVGAAIDIAARLGGELHGLFIEDADLVTVGDLDFIREFRFSSPVAHQLDRLTLEGQLRAMARSIQRQLERAGSRRKVTVGFRAVRGDLWRLEKETHDDADLVIIESTGRLHSRNYRGQLVTRRGVLAVKCPTLLLKGGQRLAPYVTIICDSVDSVDHGLQAVRALLGAQWKSITLLPFCLTEQEQAEILRIATKLSEASDQATNENDRIHMMDPVNDDGNNVLNILTPDNCVVVMKTGGKFMNNSAQLEPLLTSRHPLFFIQ